MLISLCGFMGSGKTTVGRILADALDVEKTIALNS